MLLRILIPSEVQAKLIQKLKASGIQETGGILMGEHVGENEFRVKELTVQSETGSIARFVRSLAGCIESLRSFFKKTGSNYRRFNYLGEWHSHPSFALEPSYVDCETIESMILDPRVGANFIILLLVKLQDGRLSASAFVFTPGTGPKRASISLE
jgi:hypothetical protein